ncbi:type II CRISPR RNA-guided endonuclease Cas9 [Listeria costaricensis]|uniref:type II CRISPR RNA-guided endonuclease Cas9 n=1 Tax=Listeria costaricensis TaxID=2026604 RepID=UPI000C08935C|nr:type II CRISPR RNA-guided endonuclease Cas9 [Listeria costaricensis]
MSNLILGLDVGVASVGWGLIDGDDGRIVDAGVRLFNSATASQNMERRDARGARRLTRRKKHRRERMTQLLMDAEIYKPDVRDDYNPYKLRVKGLREQLNSEELFVALFHLAKRRGISYLDDVDETEIKGDLKINADLLKEKLPCEIQLDRFEKYGKVRGIVTVNSDEKVQHLVNIFPTSAYEKEARELLREQSKYYSKIDKKFIDAYINILTGKRKYYDGPGSEKSRTNYGRFKTDGTTLDNLFEVLIGKCSVYPNELRAARASYTAQEFNVLDDLNNLKIKGEKLNKAQKEEIIEKILNSSTFGPTKMIKLISKVADCQEDDIKGYKIGKDEKPEFHTFEVYRNIQKALKDAGISNCQFSRDTYDQLAYILTLNTEPSAICAQIRKKIPQLSDSIIGVCINLKKKGNFSKWHSLSLKAMNEMIPELYVAPKNQMQIIHERGIQANNRRHLKNCKYIPVEEALNEIYNPIAARSIRQTLGIVNKILKRYGDLASIVVEMPREFVSSIEEKKEIDKMQANNEKEKKAAIQRAKKEYNFDDNAFHNHKQLALKLRLLAQQKEQCIYSGKKIDVKDLIQHPEKFQIDHIIPQSISLDDGINNKVLCYTIENQKKGQRSPFYYYKNKNKGWTYADFKQFVFELFKEGKGTITRTKKDLLLMEEDINKWEVRQGFIARNLVDTRYASRVVLNALQNYFDAHERKTKVKVVRGKFTSQQRGKWNIYKDRSESYTHHAIDALIVAATDRMKLWKKVSSFYDVTQSGLPFARTTEETFPILDKEEFITLAKAEPMNNFRNQLVDIEAEIKYSHMVSKKPNRKVSDATIYSTRKVDNKDYVVKKFKNIYDDNFYTEKFKNRYEKDKTQFLMCRHDPQTFAILESVIKTYPTAKNPFAEYKKEHGAIRKYSKKGNGPEIFDLKYIDGIYGQGIEISKKNEATPPKNGKKVVLQSITPYRADVFYESAEKRFHLIGIKYNMFHYEKESYKINVDAYKKLLEKEGITDKMSFCFSLYRGDIIEFGTNKDELQEYRFWSKDEGAKNKIKTKPIKEPATVTMAITITKKIKIFNKYMTDILGNRFLAPKEKDPREELDQ